MNHEIRENSRDVREKSSFNSCLSGSFPQSWPSCQNEIVYCFQGFLAGRPIERLPVLHSLLLHVLFGDHGTAKCLRTTTGILTNVSHTTRMQEQLFFFVVASFWQVLLSCIRWQVPSQPTQSPASDIVTRRTGQHCSLICATRMITLSLPSTSLAIGPSHEMLCEKGMAPHTLRGSEQQYKETTLLCVCCGIGVSRSL